MFFVNHRQTRSQGGFPAVAAGCALLLVFTVTSARALDYRAFMYKGGAAGRPTTVFSPEDRVVLYIQFRDLPAGEYSFQADWHNPFGELQDSSRHAFALQAASDYAVEASLEMTRAGFLTRLFSASETTGYHVKFYGKWQVRLFLNGEEVADRSFEVK